MIFNFRKRTQEISEKTTILSKIGRFLPYIFTFIIVLGVFLPFSQVSAETNYQKCMSVENNQVLCSTSPASTPLGLGGNPWGEPGAEISGSTVPTDPNAQLNQTPPPVSSGGCGLFSPGKCAMAVLAEIAQFIMMAMGWLLWLSGVLLNYVIETTVVGMASGIKNMTGIDATWRVIRDVVNIFFIFILIYQGIRLIISQSDMGKIKTVIIGVVITSVLINFSVFFTKVIIDASNLLTVGFYSSIAEASKDQVVSIDSIGLKLNSGISGAFTNALKISTLFDPNTLKSLGSDADKSITIIGLGGAVLFFVLSFVFFAISMMFIIRYVTFIILLMFSPLGFIFGIPGLESARKKWWDTLSGQAIFAPLYMFLTWAILTLISSPGFFSVPTGASYGKLFTGDNGASPIDSVGLIINFVVIIALAIFSLTKAREYAKDSSGHIADATGKLTTFAGGAIMGSAAVVGRRTIGAGADRLAQSNRFQNWAGKSFVGEKLLNTTRTAASGSFDARRSAIGEQGAKLAKVDLGNGLPFKKDAGVGGFAKTVQQKTTDREAFAQTLPSDQAKKDYAIRQADKWYVRKGSRPNQAQTLFGTMGRSNRIVASKILSGQLTNLTTARDTLQSREDSLNQQLSRMISEEATIQAKMASTPPTATPAEIVRLRVLKGPVTDRNSLDYVNDQLTTISPQLVSLAARVTAMQADMDRLGLTNPANQVVTNVATGATRAARADEQKF